MIMVEDTKNLRLKGTTKENMGKESRVLLRNNEDLDSITVCKSGNAIEQKTAVSGTMDANKIELLQLAMSQNKENITDDSTQNPKRMETTEAANNPVTSENVSIQEGAMGLEDNRGKSTNQKKWKWPAREKCGTANDGNQNLELVAGGGLSLLWKNDIEVSIRSFTKGHIDATGKSNLPWIVVGYVGNKYTWSNRQFKGDLIQERLDKAFCCLEWRKTFPAAIVLHKEWMGSDHKAIIIDKVYKHDPTKGKNRSGGSRFHFEHAWAEEVECRSIVEKVWKNKSGLGVITDLKTNVAEFSNQLGEWNKRKRRECLRELNELKVEQPALHEKEDNSLADRIIELYALFVVKDQKQWTMPYGDVRM
ncbi:hypothetical protein EZV62_007602 [Acer yangbiense]|uniref:RNase H type-1 domain-containing protein n=1 Tax=Acer yangbiense TaxID=1000413 RepID=A0A5C7IAV2_9ROSI|nr:hypothetical protein EZV62_007602 [Acer yangbiense]